MAKIRKLPTPHRFHDTPNNDRKATKFPVMAYPHVANIGADFKIFPRMAKTTKFTYNGTSIGCPNNAWIPRYS